MKKYVAAVLFLSSLIATGFTRQSIAEAASSISEASGRQSGLPRCVNAESDITKIQDIQKANSQTSSKYDGYRKALHADTDLELTTRLVYAETVAANCPDNEDQALDLIASVIGNRVRIRRGDVESVVFQRDQFASSLNIYAESRYRDFLCPKNGDRWKAALEKTRINLEGSKPSAPIPSDTVNYYLYRHSGRFKAPNWKLEEVTIAEEKTRECIRIFRDDKWK